MEVSMDYKDIAEVCHNVNKAYCEAIGDNSQPRWQEAPEWQRQSAINGVIAHLNSNLELTPQMSHELWMKEKLDNGWKYGPVKDVEKKEHPCMMPYENLPQEQRVKDYLFRQVVHSLAGHLALASQCCD
jgi:hypothetical protein